VGLDGIARVYGIARLKEYPQAGLTISVGVPEAELFAEADRGLARSLLVLAGVAVLAMSGAWVLSERAIRRPVLALMRASESLGAGDLGTRVGAPERGGEFGTLARSFDRMAESLLSQHTQIVRSEAELRRSNRALRMLSASNHALIHAAQEQGLLAEVCRIAVEVGGYRMAWVGYAEDDEAKSVRPVAHAGFDEGYFEDLRFTWADDERGRSPAGTAIRTGRIAAAHNILTGSGFAPWREAALRRGYASSMALPLRTNSHVGGAITLYAEEPDAFSDAETELITEMAGDLAYGIAALRMRQREQEAKQEIHRLNADLERRVQERTAELQAANQELEGFAYAVSHDLRAPLRAMSGFSQALLEDHGGRLDGEARNYLDQITVASRKMGELIDGLLALSRNTRGELRHDTVDLSSLAGRLLAELAAAEPARRVTWEIQPGLAARGDARMIETLMRNLLGNAWKYTARTAAPVIRFHEEQDGERFFCVSDNGAGFEMAHAGKLFQPFQRLHRQDEFPGIGIGLATVQRIVHRHGGTIRARGAPGEGATFAFTLPFSTARTEEAS
jgi:signal transduction histidine kinase/HAMP domain-containing protein